MGRAFAPGLIRMAADDCSRVVHIGESGCAVVGGVSTAPFEAINAAATRAMLDHAMTESPDGAAVMAAAGAWVRASDEAFGTLVFVELSETVGVRWIGCGGAWLLVDGEVAAITRPHSLRRELGMAAPDVATRGFGGERDQPEAETWLAPPGARVVCASWTVARIPADLVARLATGDDVERAAQRLVDHAIERESQWPAVAVVAQR